jgi:hypothetical protein
MQLASSQATQPATARHDALAWLASRLRWERTLDGLRSDRAETARRAA